MADLIRKMKLAGLSRVGADGSAGDDSPGGDDGDESSPYYSVKARRERAARRNNIEAEMVGGWVPYPFHHSQNTNQNSHPAWWSCNPSSRTREWLQP
jgi:hypothetical protein